MVAEQQVQVVQPARKPNTATANHLPAKPEALAQRSAPDKRTQRGASAAKVN